MVFLFRKVFNSAHLCIAYYELARNVQATFSEVSQMKIKSLKKQNRFVIHICSVFGPSLRKLCAHAALNYKTEREPVLSTTLSHLESLSSCNLTRQVYVNSLGNCLFSNSYCIMFVRCVYDNNVEQEKYCFSQDLISQDCSIDIR